MLGSRVGFRGRLRRTLASSAGRRKEMVNLFIRIRTLQIWWGGRLRLPREGRQGLSGIFSAAPVGATKTTSNDAGSVMLTFSVRR